MANKRILLIGGTGFVGMHLAKRLCNKHNVTIFSKNPIKIKQLDFTDQIEFVKGNISDYKSVEKNIQNQDAIVNLAAIVNPDAKFNPFEDIKVNCIGQLNILEARKNINPTSKYIFIGTRAQFGRVLEKDLPIIEEQCQNPISLYGIHKQIAENYCHLYKRAFDLDSIVIRLPQVYGPSLTKEKIYSIVDEFIKKALQNKVFYVNGYGKDIKDLIYIDDLIDLIIKILDSKVKDGVFNVGSGKKIRLINIAEKIIKYCGSGMFKGVPFPKELVNFELGSFYFDITKVSKRFGWKPKIGIDEGLKKTISYYKNFGV